MLLVTGGAGFIGSNFVLSSLAASGEPVVNFDRLTYAGNLHNLDSLRGDARHVFVRGDIRDRSQVKQALERHRPRAIAHPAAESDAFRFLHVSTDEVYGSLGPTDPAFTESTPYAPNSPYAASKAASDH